MSKGKRSGAGKNDRVKNGRVVKSSMQEGEFYCCTTFDSDVEAWVYVHAAGQSKVRVRIMYNDSGELLYDDDFGLYSLTNQLPFSFKGHLGAVFCCDSSCLTFRQVDPNVVRAMLLKRRFEDALELVEAQVVSFTFSSQGNAQDSGK